MPDRSPQPPFDRKQAEYFIATITGYGRLAFAFKLTPRTRTIREWARDTDYYLPNAVRDKPEAEQFLWQEQLSWGGDKALDDIEHRWTELAELGEGESLKVMISSCNFGSEDHRRLSNVSRALVIALDYDAQHTGPMPDDRKRDLLKLRPLIVRSGTPGSFHAYIRVGGVDGISIAEHDSLSRPLREYFNCDSKGRPNDLLGLPGTINPKNGNPVEIVKAKHYSVERRHSWPTPRRHASVRAVADIVGIDLAKPREYIDRRGPWEVPTVDLSAIARPTINCLHRRIRDWYDKNGHGDLSSANYFIASLCMEMKLDADQTYTFMTEKLDPRGYKFQDAELMHDIEKIRDRKASR